METVFERALIGDAAPLRRVGSAGQIHLDDPEWPVRPELAHQRHGNVEYRHVGPRAPLRLAMVRVAVENGGDPIINGADHALWQAKVPLDECRRRGVKRVGECCREYMI